MFISATFSKPAKDVEEKLGKAYVKIRIWKNPSPAAGGTIHSGTRRIHIQKLCRTLGKRRDDLHG